MKIRSFAVLTVAVASTGTVNAAALLSSAPVSQPPSSLSTIVPPVLTLPPPTTTVTSQPSGLPQGTCLHYEKYIDTYHLTFVPDCLALALDCRKKMKDTTYLWSKTSCVAAAVCTGARKVAAFGQCEGDDNGAFPSQADTPHLSYNVYANIVGSCAWETGGCPITQQNFVDFYYGAISAVGGTVWPPNVDFVITNYWKPILDWTKTGNTLPYTNFDDWLHYSDSS